jgi:hypothetical protein
MPVPAATPTPSNGCCTPPSNIIVNMSWAVDIDPDRFKSDNTYT